MRCPKCDHPAFLSGEPCPHCQFDGDPKLLEELDHINWLLDEIESWSPLGVSQIDRQCIHEIYLARQQKIEVELGVRLPSFSEEEARQAWPDLVQRETLLIRVAKWLEAGLINPVTTQLMVDQARQQVDELLEQLSGHSRPDYPQTDVERLAVTNFLLEAVAYLRSNRGFSSKEAGQQILAPLLAEKESLERTVGLRVEEPPVSHAAEHQAVQATAPTPLPEPPPPAPRSEAPRAPLPERLWRTLLSERTLHAILFLGIFLLFSAALSFVIWGWQNFSPLLRVVIPATFTAIFFALGWMVRVKTPLYRSGIALSAIAALLIPIDFYTIYVNFRISPEYWPTFWLLTSLFCLGAYLFATLIIQSRLFGYLVGVAAGSTVLALIEIGHQNFGLVLDWRTSGLSLLSLGFIILAAFVDRRSSAKRWRAFADPLRYLALMTVAVLMPLTFGWRYINRPTYDTLHYALTANWWLGGLIFGWGAIYYRSRSLGLLVAISLPVAVYLAQAAIFTRLMINPAWHSFGWAWLVLLYFYVGRRLQKGEDDPIIHGHGRTATGWGVALLIISALWSLTDLTDGTAAASSHTVLMGALILAAFLWRRPVVLYGASLLSLSAATFAMTELELNLTQLSVGWASLAILHIIIALSLGVRFPIPSPCFPRPVVVSGYTIAGLSLLGPLIFYDSHLLAYTLGNWLGLTAWGARLAHVRQPGFIAHRQQMLYMGQTRSFDPATIFHWLTALPLPAWLWLLFVNRRPLDFTLPLALAALAWGMVFLSYHLAQIRTEYRYPWYLSGGMVSLVAPILAYIIAPQGFAPAITLLAVGLLYFADALTGRHSGGLAAGGVVTAWGCMLLLERLGVPYEVSTLALAVLVSIYFLAGMWTESRKSIVFSPRFLMPLYLVAHALTLLTLWRIYLHPFNRLFFDIPWTDEIRLWGASCQLLLGAVYGLYAWNSYKERWGHASAWLGAAGGGFIALTYSTGRGSSAAKAALIVIAFVLAERTLHRLRRSPQLGTRPRAITRLAWRLYRRPLLWTGWTVSGIVIGLALFRNLWWLGGGRIQQIWAVVGLIMISGMYALSARLFRQVRFVWLATLLFFAPWTILTNLGWFTAYRPTLPGFAISWVVLAWLLFLTGLAVNQLAGRAYALPLFSVAHVLLPFSLLWGIANVETGRLTFGLAVGLYGLNACLDHYRYRHTGESVARLKVTKFFYPALGLIPVWCVYLLAWLLPTARHEHYGLMLLIFGPLGLIVGRRLQQSAPAQFMTTAYALPAFLTGYASVIVGTMLVAHISALLALVLLFDALLLVISARFFKNPLWIYPAAVLVPISLLIALQQAGIPANRRGWWLIGLAAIYLALSWALRRVRLPAYATSTLVVGFALVALGLPPSSQDQTGALWGYGAAALIYTLSAVWLRQPLLLTPASALILVPYAIGLQKSMLSPAYYGLALFPGAVTALALGYALEARFGRWQDFPWSEPARWPIALAERLAGWWGLPLYTLGFGLAMASPFFTDFRAGLSALNFLVLMPIFAWGIYRFRLRIWLLAMALAGHLAVVYYLEYLGWWRYPAWAWLRFLPVTLITAGIALQIELRHREGSPTALNRLFAGWSRPLYLLALFDLVIGQTLSLGGTWAGTTVTLTHAIMLAVFASAWQSGWLPYLSQVLGLVALLQWGVYLVKPIETLPVTLAQLTLAYGIIGYGLTLLRRGLAEGRELRPWLAIWELPLQRFSILISFGIILLTIWLGLDLAGWTIRAMFGLPFRQIVDLTTVRMVVGVLSLLGLLYVSSSVAHRWLRLGYLAIGMLLTGWMLYVFYIQQWDRLARVQWYAIPAGLYLLVIAYFEWERGHQVLARRLDYAALLLMMGSLFWQTLLFGWGYAVLLGAEGFSAFWWGSARRLRRFFYAGMVGAVLATLGQLVNSLRSINQWIVFGIIGLLLVAVAVLVERKLEEIKMWQEKMFETWE